MITIIRLIFIIKDQIIKESIQYPRNVIRSSIKEDMEYLDTEAKNKLIGIKNQLIKILTLSKEKNQLTTVSSNELAEAGFQ